MPFRFENFDRLGKSVSVPIPRDTDGLLGRECPVPGCKGYFKVKPATGLTGPGLQCHCPYCGHTAASDRFWTTEQVEYAKSVVLRQAVDALRADLKSLEFDFKPSGPFGLGISMKVQPGTAVPIRYYREKALETHVTCVACTLVYAVYGVFAFCPDCGAHNSHQILERNLALSQSQVALAATLSDVDLRRHLLEDALENCVSAFDGFGREACRIRAARSADPSQCSKLSFQNLPAVAKRLTDLFAVDFQKAVAIDDWNSAHLAFMRRHLIAHRSGVVDQQYLDQTGDATVVKGRRIVVEPPDVERLVGIVARLGVALLGLLPLP